jgi:A/G-specific adenine glycosylase
MLQQTRSETVRAYYERWLQRFPDLDALADAQMDDVLKAWEGLGYYSRARNLHRAAMVVRERHSGSLPCEPDLLRALPGIGEYTAGAIASIAYGRRAPAVDGNVKRVLARILDQPAPTVKLLRAAAEELVPSSRPGDFNQGLMELGATICTPRSPKCGECPVQSLCLAHANGTQLLRPARKDTTPLPSRKFKTIVVRDAAGRVLIRRRGENGLLAGLWEFPTLDELGHLTLSKLKKQQTITHTFSHFIGHYHVHTTRATRKAKAPQTATLRWVRISELNDYAMPTAQRRIVVLISQYLTPDP